MTAELYKIYFINPPYLKDFSRGQRSPGVIKSGTMYYPYWLASAAGVLEMNGFAVRLIDAPADNMNADEIFRLVSVDKPELAVIDTSTPSIENDILFAKRLKDHNNSIIVCLVGTHASAEAESILKANPEIDIIAIGEYDYTILDIAKAVSNHGSFNGIPGVCARSGNSITSSTRPLIEDLDKLPFLSAVYKKHLNIKNYCFTITKNPMVMTITGRGCPNRCFYCVYPQVMFGHKYRFRSPENVIKELQYIKHELPEVKEVLFEDDTFSADVGRVRAISELIIQNGIKMDWFANLRVNIDYDTLKLMKKAGFNSCAVGFESGNQELLNNAKKGIKLEQSYVFMDNCRKLGIYVHGCFMVGYPGETRATMEETFQFAKRLKCDSVQFYPVFLYPGTEAFNWSRENGYLLNVPYSEWLDDTGRHKCVYNLPGISAGEMMSFCENAYKRYYLRIDYILGRLLYCIRKPGEAMKFLNSGFNYIKYLTNK